MMAEPLYFYNYQSLDMATLERLLPNQPLKRLMAEGCAQFTLRASSLLAEPDAFKNMGLDQFYLLYKY